MVREGFPDDIELRLRDKQEPDTQGSGEGSSKEREQQKPETEAGISPMWTKDRKKATAEEGDGWGLVGGGRTV